MAQTQPAPTMPFQAIIGQAIDEAFSPSLLRFAPYDVLEAYAFRTLETPLVYLLDERRVREKLTGDSRGAVREILGGRDQRPERASGAFPQSLATLAADEELLE